MNALRWIVLLAAVAGAALLLTRGCDEGVAPENSPSVASTSERTRGSNDEGTGTEVAPATAAGPADPAAIPSSTGTERTEVQFGGHEEDLAQGVRGRAVNLRGIPIEGATVFLMEGLGSDIFTQMQLAQRRVTLPPVARSKTDSDGNFRLGLRQARPDRKYEVRILHDRHADAHVPGIQLGNEQWFDCGSVQMAVGAVVYGRVTVAGTQSLPVAGAQVFAKIIRGLSGMNPAPGRERGIETRTDESGNYRFENVGQGLVSISALAPGYAKVERPSCTISHSRDNRYDFVLPRGRSISGVVTDVAGRSVDRARVTAVAISAKMPIYEETVSDSEGQFVIHGLVDGPYQLTAIAPGFVEGKQAPVQAGATDAQIALESQCAARVEVLTPSGRAVETYQVGIRRYFEGEEQFGNVATVPDRQVHPRDLDRDGRFQLGGVDPGGYVIEVVARGFAKTYSEPILLRAGMSEAPVVRIELLTGGQIAGLVRGADGEPLAGARVATQPNHAIDNPLMSVFAAAVPWRVTRTSTTTDARGRYALETLAPGAYQLQFSHPDYTDVRRLGIVVQNDKITEVPTERLETGVIIHGITYVDGVPTPFVKVTVASTVAPDGDGSQRVVAGEAISNAQGEYEITTQFPAGSYEGRASRQTLGAPILQVIDFNQTQTPFDLTAGMRRYKLDFAIQSNAIGK